jgi:hypothetical protein
MRANLDKQMNESNPKQTTTPEADSWEQQWSILVWRKAYNVKKALQAAQLAEYLATLPVDAPEMPVTEISAQMLIYYVKRAIVSWFYVNADLPKDQEDFKERAEFASWNAEQFGDMDTLTLGIEYILAHSQIDAARFNNSKTPLSDQQMRKILGYIKQTLQPDTSILIRGVKLVSMPLKEWYASHGKHPERILQEVVLSEHRLRKYLGCLTNVVGLEDDMPEDLEGYYIYALDIQRSARRNGYLEQLRLGIEYVLGNPENDTKFLMHDKHFCEPDEMRELLRYIWEIIWPNVLPIPSGGPPGVTIVKDLPEDEPIIWD